MSFPMVLSIGIDIEVKQCILRPPTAFKQLSMAELPGLRPNPAGGLTTPSAVHKGCSQVRLTAHIPQGHHQKCHSSRNISRSTIWNSTGAPRGHTCHTFQTGTEGPDRLQKSRWNMLLLWTCSEINANIWTFYNLTNICTYMCTYIWQKICTYICTYIRQKICTYMRTYIWQKM